MELQVQVPKQGWKCTEEIIWKRASKRTCRIVSDHLRKVSRLDLLFGNLLPECESAVWSEELKVYTADLAKKNVPGAYFIMQLRDPHSPDENVFVCKGTARCKVDRPPIEIAETSCAIKGDYAEIKDMQMGRCTTYNHSLDYFLLRVCLLIVGTNGSVKECGTADYRIKNNENPVHTFGATSPANENSKKAEKRPATTSPMMETKRQKKDTDDGEDAFATPGSDELFPNLFEEAATTPTEESKEVKNHKGRKNGPSEEDKQRAIIKINMRQPLLRNAQQKEEEEGEEEEGESESSSPSEENVDREEGEEEGLSSSEISDENKEEEYDREEGEGEGVDNVNKEHPGEGNEKKEENNTAQVPTAPVSYVKGKCTCDVCTGKAEGCPPKTPWRQLVLEMLTVLTAYANKKYFSLKDEIVPYMGIEPDNHNDRLQMPIGTAFVLTKQVTLILAESNSK